MRANATYHEALERAENGTSHANYQLIRQGFERMGINDIRPRVNILTYAAWKAKGRQVMKGQKGVSVVTWITLKSRDRVDPQTGDAQTFKRKKRAIVFHVSQTKDASLAAQLG